MGAIASDIDAAEIDRAIDDRFPLLRFTPPIERQFEADVAARRCSEMIRINYIGLIIYHCFLFSDYRAIGDVIFLDIAVHFLITTPIVIGTNLILARNPPVWVREGLETVTALVVAATIFAVTSASRMPDRDIVHFSLALIVLGIVTMQRVRFPYAVAGCLVVQAIYGVGLLMMSVSMDRMIMANSIFFGIVLFSLVGAYALEHEHRMSYLLRLREQLRNRDLERASLRDALTGIANRRALDAALDRLTDGRAKPVALLLLDIDHFKLFNDTNGHQDGDDCLRRVAGLISASLRVEEGAAYRFGGEEFVVLFDCATREEALIVAERIRSDVERAGIPRDRTTSAVVTISVGAASGLLGDGAAPQALIAAADRALYAAKREGRNRVEAAPNQAPASGMRAPVGLAVTMTGASAA